MSISVIDALDRNFLKNIARDGYAIIPDLIDVKTINSILSELDQITADQAISRRAGRAFGIRNLLNVLPSARTFAESSSLLSLVELVLGPGARVVRGVYFDKHRDANWKVAWHQDLTIAVRERGEADGYGPWSLKAGINHVQPPAEVLEGILALRIHFDDTDATNGALRVLPGSHKYGRLSAPDIQTRKSKSQVATCTVPAGGVMLMRPLLLHASSAATHPRRRRVLHFEYSALALPGGMAWYDASL
jgi:ectoine hydroxylase-related dioxygenase (phytanoyl-CoA dioxygenase family)